MADEVFKTEGTVLDEYKGTEKDVVIPNGVTGISAYAFKDNKTLVSVTIPEGVSEIGEYAFMGCTSLASASIPASVTSIESQAFDGCRALKEIRYAGTDWWGISKGYAWNRGVPATEAICPNGPAAIERFPEITEDENFRYKDSAIQRYKGAGKDVVIPEGVTAIGREAFMSCTSLASVVIPGSVTYIDGSAFNRCTSLTSVSIPASVTAIDNSTFSDCTALASVSIPESVTTIGDNAFDGCTSLSDVRYAGSKEQWEKIEKGEEWSCHIPAESVQCADGGVEVPKFDIKDGELEKYLGAAPSVTIPEGVTKIGGRAFDDCKSLASVTIPEGVTEIGSSAFRGCTSLSSVTIPEGVTEIGSCAFMSCTSLASVTIPGSVTEIGFGAFEDCTSLASVTIPEGVTKIGGVNGFIGYGAFKGCTSLASISIPVSVTEIGENAFFGCTSLAEIHYAGSKEQWYAVEKGEDWNKDVPATDVLVRKEPL